MGKMIKASECKCVVCGKRAVCFWPCCDPDIPEQPYCRKCVNKAKLQVMIDIFGDAEGKRLFKELKRKL